MTETNPSKPADHLQELHRAAGFQWSGESVSPDQAMITKEGTVLSFLDRHPDRDHDLFVNVLAAVLCNLSDEELKHIGRGDEGDQQSPLGRFMTKVDELLSTVDAEIQRKLAMVLRDPAFREIERNFRMLSELVDAVTTDKVEIDVLDVTVDELREDIRDNVNHIMGSSLFQRLYVDEYDRFGGIPFGSVIGLFEVDPSNDEDLQFLRGLGKLASHCHAPFVGSLSPAFFGLSSFSDLASLDQLEAVLERPRYGKWEAFRDEHEAAYIGLTLPRYLLRKPHETSGESRLRFTEEIRNGDDYLWGNAAALLARNMIRSFELSGWCQHLRGPEGGGLVKGLPVHVFVNQGHVVEQPPVDAALPDYLELQLAMAGFIPLVSKKDEPDQACFFSVQSAKKPKTFVEEIATQNAHLVTNLSYTLSVSRIAHYIKRMVRDYIGSSADGPYIQQMLESWLAEYVTTVTNPDDRTLARYPFKAVSVTVEPKVGALGWYKCTTSILPHVQFEGMDVELRLEAALGG